MISKGSCDTEDWNNAENSALITGLNDILKYIQIENSYFKLLKLLKILLSLLYFYQINSLGEQTKT